MLSGEKDLAVAAERLFKGAHAGLAAHHEGRHHVREDDHVPDGHHGQLARFGLFAGCGHKFPNGGWTRETGSGCGPVRPLMLRLYTSKTVNH